MRTFRFEKIFFSLIMVLRFCYRANEQRFEQFIQDFDNKLNKIK